MNIQFPFCVILTHRHGACVGIFTNAKSHILNQKFSGLIDSIYIHHTFDFQQEGYFEYIEQKNDFIIARALGKTAENLYDLYKFVCEKLNLCHLKSIFMGVGPGSFTGLRLGCAFANGLNLSLSHDLYALKTLFRSELFELLHSTHKTFSSAENESNILLQSLYKELGDYRESDDASGFITFFDMFYALDQIWNCNFSICNTLIPHYGREPTPVLNLRKD